MRGHAQCFSAWGANHSPQAPNEQSPGAKPSATRLRGDCREARGSVVGAIAGAPGVVIVGGLVGAGAGAIADRARRGEPNGRRTHETQAESLIAFPRRYGSLCRCRAAARNASRCTRIRTHLRGRMFQVRRSERSFCDSRVIVELTTPCLRAVLFILEHGLGDRAHCAAKHCTCYGADGPGKGADRCACHRPSHRTFELVCQASSLLRLVTFCFFHLLLNSFSISSTNAPKARTRLPNITKSFR